MFLMPFTAITAYTDSFFQFQFSLIEECNLATAIGLARFHKFLYNMLDLPRPAIELGRLRQAWSIMTRAHQTGPSMSSLLGLGSESLLGTVSDPAAIFPATPAKRRRKSGPNQAKRIRNDQLNAVSFERRDTIFDSGPSRDSGTSAEFDGGISTESDPALYNRDFNRSKRARDRGGGQSRSRGGNQGGNQSGYTHESGHGSDDESSIKTSRQSRQWLENLPRGTAGVPFTLHDSQENPASSSG